MEDTLEIKAKKIKYDKRTLELINNLSRMNSKLSIEKSEDGKFVYVNGTNVDTSVFYGFKVSSDRFDFEGEQIVFQDYSQFYEYFNVLESPDIFQDDEKFEIKKGKSRISYYLADPDIIDETFDGAEFEDPDYTFKLTKEELKHIQKMINLFDAEKVTLTIENKKITLKLSKEGNEKDNFYETDFECSYANDEEFSLPLKISIWDNSPDGDYVINVKEEGIVNFSLVEEGVSLELYSGEIEEE